jgi:hypothetical protein
MKRLSLLLAFAALASVLASCTPARRAGLGYRPYGIYSATVYDDAPGGWDVYRGRGGGTRVKYSE